MAQKEHSLQISRSQHGGLDLTPQHHEERSDVPLSLKATLPSIWMQKTLSLLFLCDTDPSSLKMVHTPVPGCLILMLLTLKGDMSWPQAQGLWWAGLAAPFQNIQLIRLCHSHLAGLGCIARSLFYSGCFSLKFKALSSDLQIPSSKVPNLSSAFLILAFSGARGEEKFSAIF